MPPKTIFAKEDIVETAFQLVRQHGKKKFSARAIAKELQASTMPIYSAARSMNELEQEVHKKFRSIFLRYATTSWTGNALLDMAFGFVRFAKDEKQLFRLMFATDDATEVAYYKAEKKIVEPLLRERVKAQPEFHAFTDEQIQYMMDFMGIFMQGLAGLINDGRLDDDSDEMIAATLQKAYHAFLQQAQALPSRSPHAKED